MTEDHAQVWDTRYLPPARAFSAFHAAVSGSFMPWSPEPTKGKAFKARMEGMTLDAGFVGRIKTVPSTGVRTASNIAHSSLDGVYVSFILSGEAEVAQSVGTNSGRAGDLLIFDGGRVTTHRHGPSQFQDAIALLVPKTELGDPLRDELCRNLRIPRSELLPPLSACLRFMTENLLTISKSEMQSLFDACLSMLPVATGSQVQRNGPPASQDSTRLRELFDFVDRKLSSVGLSANLAAEHLGVSDRYVHKMLASRATTFSAYVLSKRLERVRADLLSIGCRGEEIAAIAYRWGFNDLSYFNRAFKRRYGCTPRQLRASELRL